MNLQEKLTLIEEVLDVAEGSLHRKHCWQK